jgi:hypothetical protein
MKREVDKTDPRTAPELIMDLRDGGYARTRIFQRVSDVCRIRTTCLNVKQADNRGEAVFDAMTHLPRKQVLIFDRLCKLRVGLLTFDGDAQQSRKSGQEIGICVTGRDPGYPPLKCRTVHFLGHPPRSRR